MYGVMFGDKHSFINYGLVLTSKDIPLPDPKTYKVSISGSDGVLDLSTALTNGEMKYSNRKIKLKFSATSKFRDLEYLKSLIANDLHGKKVQLILDHDPEFYYSGTATVTEFSTAKSPATVTISVDAEPYKLRVAETVWTKTVSSSEQKTFDDTRMPVVPTINVTAQMTLEHKTVQYTLFPGDNILPAVRLSSGANNTLKFIGSGTVTVKYREGEL